MAYDVIVVGGGAAGMPLSLCAAGRGAKVLLLESMPVLGGTLDRSWASIAAAGTRQQAEHSIEDSPQAHFDDVMRISRGEADPVVTRLWVENAAATVAWLESMGARFRFTPHVARGPGAHEPYSLPRVMLVEGRGKALIDLLSPKVAAAVRQGAIDLRLQSRVVGLQREEDGAISGVLVEDNSGAVQSFAGRATVLTTGGCLGNWRLYEDLHRTPVYFDAGFPGCRGDGLRLAQSAGATLRGGERYCPLLGLVMSDETIPSYPSGGDFLKDSVNASAIDRPPWEIWVNSRAERFVREDAPSPQEKEQALRRQPGHSFWMIHDAAMLAANGSPITGWSHEAYAAAFGRNPMCFKAPTLRSLALLAGLDARALSSTVEQYNLAQRRSAADAFGRVHRPSAIESGPFYAVRLQGYTLQSFAGVRVDGRLRVVRDDGSPIPNLYAAGEILGGTAVGSSAYSTGSMATSALTFGRLLGESMIPS